MRAVGIIGLGRLIECMRHAHPCAADDLLLDHARIEGAANLIGALERQHLDIARFGIDFDFSHRAGVRITGGRRHLPRFRLGIGARLQEHAAARYGLAVLEMCRKRSVDDRDRFLRTALHMDIALAVGLEIGSIDLELLARHFEHDRLGFLGRYHDGVADAVGAARSEGAHAVRPGVGIGRIDDHVFGRHPDRLGADLRHDRLEPLTDIDARQCDDEASRRSGVDERLRWVAAEIHAGRIVDRRHAASALLHHLIPRLRR